MDVLVQPLKCRLLNFDKAFYGLEKVEANSYICDEMPKHHAKSLNHCPSCAADYDGKYCYNCGEKTFHESDFTIRKFLEHTVDMFTHFDGKFLRSLKYLFGKPGFLTLQNMRGARVKYAKPIQIFLLANVFFFFVVHIAHVTDYTPNIGDQQYGGLSNYFLFKWFEPIDEAIIKFIDHVADIKFVKLHMAQQDFVDHFLENSILYSKAFLIMLVPLYAGVLYLFNFKGFKFFSFSLIFSAHFLAFQLAAYTIFNGIINGILGIHFYRPIYWLLYETPLHWLTDFFFTGAFEAETSLLFWMPYLFIALRRIFGHEHWAITFIKSYFLSRIFHFITFIFYKKLLILLTLWFMH